MQRRPTIRRLLFLLGVVAAGAAAPLAAQTIDTIVVDNRTIFEPLGDAPGIVERLGDALHVRTRASVIRRTLFFDQGDPYDSARVLESERALRGLQVFRDVRLDTMSVDGKFAVKVTTADGWSTRPQVGFASAAGDVSWDVGVVERNLFGTAMHVTADYRKTPDRSQLTLAYQAPGFLLRRAQLVTAYEDLSDGAFGAWYYGVPFYETSAKASLATYGQAGTLRVLRFRDGYLADSVQQRVASIGLTGGIALSATEHGYARLRMFARWRRENFRPYAAAAADSQSFAAGAGLELGRTRFGVVEGLDQYARREDVDVSQRLWVGLWAAPRAFGYAPGRAGVGSEIQAQLGTAWRDGFAWLRLNADGLIAASGLDSGRVEGGVTAMTQRFRRQTLILHAEGGAARRVAPGTEFDLWLWENGPRAFGAHAFTGTRRYWVVAEDRFLVAPDFLGLFGVGLAPFAEWGGAWYPDERPRAGGDVGLALRVGSTRSTRGGVTEISIASRFGQGFAGGGGWAVTLREAVDFR
jgi:hypothetical protein